MGWSCRTDAMKTMDRWIEKCVAQTGSQNVFNSDGTKYFWENSCRELADGGIGGKVFCMTEDSQGVGTASLIGTFRIGGDGRILRCPKVLRTGLGE